ncbi:GDP-mannose transporter into the lumen of the Golgi [Microbotryomycetes sp. JL201]|nr:GDP-mannose transporter into the lumen of the Golgi [Microbotryomycetes sp. JL201]
MGDSESGRSPLSRHRAHASGPFDDLVVLARVMAAALMRARSSRGSLTPGAGPPSATSVASGMLDQLALIVAKNQPAVSSIYDVRILSQLYCWAKQADLSIISVCFASLSMTVANKYIVSGRSFSMNFLMLAVQSIVSASAVWAAKNAKVIDYPAFSMEDAKKWSPVSLGLVTMMYTGSKALQHLSIPVYVIFKNLTIILIAYGEMIWFGGTVSRLEFSSFVLMASRISISRTLHQAMLTPACRNPFQQILSSVIAAAPNIAAAFSSTPVALASEAKDTNTALGYFWVITNCLVCAAYILGMRNKIKSMGFTDWQTSFYNNAISTPVLLVASIVTENWSAETFEKNFPADSRTYLISAMIVSGGVAVFISFCSAWCIRVTSSTTYSMIGALNKLPVAVTGMIFFGDPVTVRSVSAVTIGFAAGLLYTHAKQLSNEAKKRAQTMSKSSARHDEEAAIPLMDQNDTKDEHGGRDKT